MSPEPNRTSSLTALLEPGIPDVELAVLRDLLEENTSDAALIRKVQCLPQFLLAFLRHASGLRTRPELDPVDAAGAWRLMGSKRSRAYLKALLLLSPRRSESTELDLFTAKLRRLGEELSLKSGVSCDCVRSLLVLMEFVALNAWHQGTPAPPRSAWPLALLSFLETQRLRITLLLDPLRVMQQDKGVEDPAAVPRAALLSLTLMLCLENQPAAEELSRYSQVLNVNPWIWIGGEEQHA